MNPTPSDTENFPLIASTIFRVPIRYLLLVWVVTGTIGCATTSGRSGSGKIVTNVPTTYEALVEAGDQFMAAGDPYWALSHYRRANQTHSHEPGLQYRIAKSSLLANQRSSGLAAIDNLKILRPETSDDADILSTEMQLKELAARDHEKDKSLIATDDLIFELKYSADSYSRDALTKKILRTLYPYHVTIGQDDTEVWRCLSFVALSNQNVSFASHCLPSMLSSKEVDSLHYSKLIDELKRIADPSLVAKIKKTKASTDLDWSIGEIAYTWQIAEGLVVPPDGVALVQLLEDRWEKKYTVRNVLSQEDGDKDLAYWAQLTTPRDLFYIYALGWFGESPDSQRALEVLAEVKEFYEKYQYSINKTRHSLGDPSETASQWIAECIDSVIWLQIGHPDPYHDYYEELSFVGGDRQLDDTLRSVIEVNKTSALEWHSRRTDYAGLYNERVPGIVSRSQLLLLAND